MSRAFVKEPDGDDGGTELPDRPLSAHPNFVTPSGLAQIDAEIGRLRRLIAEAQAQAETNKSAIAGLARDLRYWSARRASAELVTTPTGDEVRFGSTVAIERDDGRRQTFRITGEDEANPAEGTLSYVAPLARALMGRRVADQAEFQGDNILILSIGSEPASP